MAVGFAVLLFLGISSLFVLLTLIFCAVVLLHDLRKKYSHIPGPSIDSFIWGNSKIFQAQKSKILVFKNLFHKHGPVLVTWHVHKPLVSVLDQDVIQDAFELSNLKDPISNDDFWDLFEQRFLARGATFTYGANLVFNDIYIKRHLTSINNYCETFIKMLQSMADEHTEIKMKEQFDRLTDDVIAKVAFGIDLNCMQDPDVPFYKALRECQNAISWSIAHPFHHWDVSSYDYQNDLIEAVKYLRDYGKKVIDRRRTAMHNGDVIQEDYLTWMLSTGDRDDSITLGDLLDEFLCVFISGQGQFSSLLSSMLLELLKHPATEEKVYEEIINTISNSPVIFEHFNQLKFTSCVMKETLRLHPPVSAVFTKTRRRGRIAGYRIQDKTKIQMIPYIIQRSPKRWQHPNVFSPKRFLDVDGVRLSTLFPFALRKHNYLNDSFAECLVKVVFPNLLQKLKFIVKENQDIGPSPDLFSGPKDGVVCTLSPI